MNLGKHKESSCSTASNVQVFQASTLARYTETLAGGMLCLPLLRLLSLTGGLMDCAGDSRAAGSPSAGTGALTALSGAECMGTVASSFWLADSCSLCGACSLQGHPRIRTCKSQVKR